MNLHLLKKRKRTTGTVPKEERQARTFKQSNDAKRREMGRKVGGQEEKNN